MDSFGCEGVVASLSHSVNKQPLHQGAILQHLAC